MPLSALQFPTAGRQRPERELRKLRRAWQVFAALCASLLVLVGRANAATVPSLVTVPVDIGAAVPLTTHHPAWAMAANRIASLGADQDLEQLTLVLARPASQQAALEQFLADQQDPSSPNYHKWLTPEEVGARFGLSDSDLAAITSWLTRQGLHVNFVAPTRTAIQFGGTAANLGRAFQTTLSSYSVRGQQRYSVDTDPSIPQALAPAISAVRGLFSPSEHPLHSAANQKLATPAYTLSSNGNHFLTPADFATIYDVPSSFTGAGVTIGIVSWSRIDTADLDAFRSITGSSFPNPQVVIPTAYGGVEPGAAYTTEQSCSNGCLDGQEEATLDVIRAGGTAPGANLLLVASSVTSTNNDGIGADTQYMVYTSPVPVQVLSISFGSCESSTGASGVTFWDDLFSAAAAEGISVFVSSGDSGAAGCDAAFSSTLPGSLTANSPNSICSSQYATCVGGTEFNDTANPALYWNSNNGVQGQSALSYIPEGAWNESSTASGLAASGGGVSLYVATPTWQSVTGVPSAHAGRYTPDMAFAAAAHDGYLGCMAAAGADCVSYISIFSGTSAAAPSMAGIAALLDQRVGSAQGNLNPILYAKYTSAPSAFHDVTASSGGVASCSTSAVSLCNNSVYYSSSGSVQPGYAVNTGYDEVTGLGSLDVANFLNAFGPTVAPGITLSPSSTSITTAQNLWSTVTVTASGSGGTPTGTVQLFNGSTAVSSAVTLSSGSASVELLSGALPAGTASLTAAYTPDSASSSTYSAVSSRAVSVTVSIVTPTVTVHPASSSVNTNQSLAVSITVSGGSGAATATGTVTLTSGSYTSTATALSSGAASITVPAGALPAGTDSLSASYTPDTAGATLYTAATSTAVSVTASKVAPSVSVTPASVNLTTTQALPVSLAVSAGAGAVTATGTVTLTSGSYTSAATALSAGTASITIPAGALPGGTDSLTANYTPDATASTLYTAATSTAIQLNVSKATPIVTVVPGYSSIVPNQALAVSIAVSAGTSTPTATGSVVLAGGGYTSSAITLSSGIANLTIPAGTFGVSTPTLTASYTPDTVGTTLYNSASGHTSLTVAKVAPSVSLVASPASITILEPTNITVTVAGSAGNPAPTGSVVLTSGSYTSTPATLSSGSASITIPAGTLPRGTPNVTASYTPDAASLSSFNTNSGSATVSVGTVAPAVTVSASPSTLTTLQTTVVTVTLAGGTGNPTVTGAVVVSSGSYTSASTTLSSGAATFHVPAGVLAAGTPPLTATYTPDTPGTTYYKATTGSTQITVTAVAPTVTALAAPSSITTLQATTVTISVSGGTSSPTPSGSVSISSGSYNSASATLVTGAASITIPAGTLPAGTSTVTAYYTPDASGAATYTAASATTGVTVRKVAPAVVVQPTVSSISLSQPLTVVVSVSGGTGAPAATGTVTLTGGTYVSAATILSGGSASIIVPAYTFSAGVVSLTATYTPDTAGAATYNSSTGSGGVTYTPAPSFTLNGTSVTVSGGSSATATITVTPFYGFTGAVALTANISSKPAGAQYTPSLSFGATSPATITGTSVATSTLTVSTTSTTAAAPVQPLPLGRWRIPATATLTSLVLLLAPVRRRRWFAWFGMLALSLTTLSGLIACGSAAITTASMASPTVVVLPASSSINSLQALPVNVTVTGSVGTPTGTVTLASGSYSSSAVPLSASAASFSIPAGSLAVGTDTLTATYTPDATAAASYAGAKGANTVNVVGVSTAGNYVVTVTGTSGNLTASTTVNVTVQ